MADRMPSSEQRDPLAGDWSEGLPGPSRAHGLPAPQPLFVEAETARPARPLEELSAQPPAEVADAPDAWGAAGEDPLQSAPPEPLQSTAPEPLQPVPPEPLQPAPQSTPPSAAEGAGPDPFAFAPPAPFAPGTPLAPATAFAPLAGTDVDEDEIVELNEDDEAEPAEAAAEPVEGAADAACDAVESAQPADRATDAAWDAAPADAAADAAWDAVTAHSDSSTQPSQSHEAALLSEIETAEPIVEEPAVELKPQDEVPASEPPPADWSTFSKGPDWSAPAPAAASAEAPAWGAPAEPAQTWSSESAWTAPAEAAAPAAEPEWSAPPPAAPEPAGWTSANTTLLQMEGEPEPVPSEPGAAQELFGSVPVGGSLSDDDENELPAAEELEDPDLPVPVDEEPQPLALHAEEEPQPLGLAVDEEPQPLGLRIPGEHRVAVHTRGGSTKRGVVRDVDLSQRAFALESASGGDGEHVQHDDVKAIFFMLPPGESPRRGGHGKVKVTFADGRTIEGERDGAEDKNGFFLVPQDAARTNTWRIYVARDATTEIRDL
ncbi:MAG TPA: hypothetical protein VGH20_14320 [Myxococcales bacterium]|jgi:hypothetical protein